MCIPSHRVAPDRNPGVQDGASMRVLSEELSAWYGAGRDLGTRHQGTRNVRSDGCTPRTTVQRADAHTGAHSDMANLRHVLLGVNWKENTE